MPPLFATNKPGLLYILGPHNWKELSEDTRIEVKIGLSNNNVENFTQRLRHRQTQVPGTIELASHETKKRRDAPVRHHLCRNFPLMFRDHRGAGREVVSLLVKDLPFLLQEAARFLNEVDTGNWKTNSFTMRAEQEACLAKTIRFQLDPSNLGREFLWDCKMRFGKTHTAYELIMSMDHKIVLILTGRPTDTKQSWIEAMDHVDFDFGIDNFIDASKQGSTPIEFNRKGRTIIFASLQDFARLLEGAFKEKFKHFPTALFDLVICDECHLAFDTAKTKEALSLIKFKHLLNLSGTPFRALLEERFSDDQKFTWSYLNEQSARLKELQELGLVGAQEGGDYYWLCPMKVFTMCLSSDLYKDAELFTEDEGFTFTKLFATEERNGRVVFLNEKAVAGFLDSLCHGLVMPYSLQSHNSLKIDSSSLKHTLWYLPGVAACELLAKMLKKHQRFKQYDVVVAAGDNNKEGNETVRLVKGRIANLESGYDQVHTGTITLSCGKLSHGVSIPEWGSIFNLSDIKSAQLYFQLMFRAQTPWDEVKHECYVFDFNPNRTLEHMHTLASMKANTGDIKPHLTEILSLFNVLCYDETEFNRVDAADLISKLNAGFGRSTSLTGLQTLLSELSVDIADLDSCLDDIEDGSAKTTGIEVNSNDAPNGKNTRQVGDAGGSGEGGGNASSGSDKQENDQTATEEQKKLRVKLALRSVPLFFFVSGDESFDSLIENLVANTRVCKTITGLPGSVLKKILEAQPKEKKEAINLGIQRFRDLERKDHQSFQDEVIRK